MADELARLADIIAEQGRRIAALETAPRAAYTTVRQGVTAYRGADADHACVLIFGATDTRDAAAIVYTQDDQLRAWYGALDNGTTAALLLNNPDNSGTAFAWYSNAGVVGPFGLGPWTKNPGQTTNSLGHTTTTSGTAQVGWRTLLNASTANLFVEYYADPGGATSAEITLTATVFHDDRASYVPGPTQTIFTRTITSANNYSNTATLPTSLWSPAASPVGSLLKLELTGRVASGAGTVGFAPTLPAVVT